MAREITYLTDVYMITCVGESGLADKIVEAATNVGAQGATINYARGTGVRDRMGLLGVTIDEQKEVIRIIASKEQSNRVFESMYLAGNLDTPGKGIMWIVKLDRVAPHIPKDVLKKVFELLIRSFSFSLMTVEFFFIHIIFKKIIINIKFPVRFIIFYFFIYLKSAYSFKIY